MRGTVMAARPEAAAENGNNQSVREEKRSMMHKNVRRAGVMTAALALAVMISAPVSAQEIAIIGKKCPLTFISDRAGYEAMLAEAGASEEGVSEEGVSEEGAADAAANLPCRTEMVDHLDVLGTLDGQYAVALYDREKVLVPLSEVAEKLPAVNTDELPSAQNWSNLGRGSSGELARTLQQMLIDGGYLEGQADGAFGGMTAEAVAAFQTAAGMEATGEADLYTFFALCEEAAGGMNAIETEYPPVFTVEEKFAAICADAADPTALEAYLDPEWKFSYDVFDGVGEISRGVTYGSYSDETRPIDRISIDVREVVYVARNEAGEVDVIPALSVESVGAYRPYVKDVLVRNGNDVETLPTLVKTGALNGLDVAETAIVPLTDEAAALLEQGSGTVLRIEGSGRTYDLALNGN